MTQLQADLAISLFAAHVISDFFLQTDRGVEAKKRTWVLVGHCLVVAVLGYLLAGLWTIWQIPLAIFVTHLLMDFIKRRYLASGLRSFALDQVIHLAVIAAMVYVLPRMADQTQVASWHDVASGHFYPWLLGAAGFFAATYAGSVLVGLAIQPLQKEDVRKGETGAGSDPGSPSREGFPRGGKVIGLLERAMIFVLVVSGQPSAIGFLIAAKSILRFGEIGSGANRKEVEYIIIGTLMSFLIALAVSYLTRAGYLEYRAAWPN